MIEFSGPTGSRSRKCISVGAAQEEEAQWLAGALLISDEAALSIVRRKLSLQDAAQLYGVSVDMIRGRMNVTGARRANEGDGARK